MKTKTPEQIAANASKLHKHVGLLLANELFSGYEIRQEYPVNRVNVSFKSGREKFDWVILGINVVIEVHGEQHFRKVMFGGIDGDKAGRNFRKRMEVDDIKEQAARDAGWAYVVVRYDEKNITAEELNNKITKAIAEVNTDRVESIVLTKPKAKISHPKEYNWPKGKKIPGRKFNGEPNI